MRKKITNLFVGILGWARNQDFVVLLLSFTAAAGAWIFIEIADEVREGETNEFDKAVLRAFRNPADLSDPIGPRNVEEAVRDITALGSVAVLGLVSTAMIGFLLFSRKYQAVLLLSAALAGGLLLNWSLKNYFSRPRPEYVTPLHHVSTYSFPSGHSLLSAVVYLTIGALLARMVKGRRLKVYILGCSLLAAGLVGISRVYLGVHYPTDVLAGWTVGLLWAIICWLAARYIQRRNRAGKLPSTTSSA